MTEKAAPTVALDFSDALRHLKNGAQIARAGWNGKGMHVRLLGGDDAIRLQPFLALRTPSGDLNAWVTSQADVLATDWEATYPAAAAG